jgi:hypothetical protein
MDAAVSGAILARTNDAVAYGEVVWSWRPDAGAKLAMMLRITPMTVAKEPGSPGGARRKPLKPLRREGRVAGLDLWFCRVRFLLHADHGCQPTPGLPCALFFEMRVVCLQKSGISSRENAMSCRQSCRGPSATAGASRLPGSGSGLRIS